VAHRADLLFTLSDGLVVSDEGNGQKLTRWVMEADHETN
jgi:hypothetical protein